jgi:hypothetical protein
VSLTLSTHNPHRSFIEVARTLASPPRKEGFFTTVRKRARIVLARSENGPGSFSPALFLRLVLPPVANVSILCVLREEMVIQ